MPKVGQRVIIVAENSSKYGQTGKVSEIDASNVGRPYIVQFRGGVERKFRRGDVYKRSQIEFV